VLFGAKLCVDDVTYVINNRFFVEVLYEIGSRPKGGENYGKEEEKESSG
jgi:hypothetical protein